MNELLANRPTITLALARQVAAAAEAEALQRGWTVAIAIVDDGANLLYLQRLDGTQLASPEIAVAKAVSAVKYKRSTKALADALTSGRQAVLALPGAMPVEGGLLLVCNETIVGAIGVSGVQPVQDDQVAHVGVAAFAELIGR